MTELAGTDDDQRWMLPVTSAHDGLEHLVTEDTMTLGTAGRYTGLCGRRVWAAVLACPAGPPCPDCLAVRDTPVPGGRGNRRGRWPRLISWLTRRRRARHTGKPEVAGAGRRPAHCDRGGKRSLDALRR
jgi:hypothetical protein